MGDECYAERGLWMGWVGRVSVVHETVLLEFACNDGSATNRLTATSLSSLWSCHLRQMLQQSYQYPDNGLWIWCARMWSVLQSAEGLRVSQVSDRLKIDSYDLQLIQPISHFFSNIVGRRSHHSMMLNTVWWLLTWTKAISACWLLAKTVSSKYGTWH